MRDTGKARLRASAASSCRRLRPKREAEFTINERPSHIGRPINAARTPVMKHALAPLAVALTFLVAASAQAAERVHIAVPTWVGFGPLYVARDKGFFAKHGVDAVLTASEDAKQHYPLLLAGKYDMVAGAAGTSVLYIKNSDDLQYVTILDDSNGGDGIVARNEITSIGDLRGKSIGVNVASISEFYLNVLLRAGGLSEKDVTVVEMSPTEAGRAFMAQRVDAAVTWEPFLSEAKHTDFGHLLTDSSTVPGLLCDVLVVRKSFLHEHPSAVRGMVAAWKRRSPSSPATPPRRPRSWRVALADGSRI
jgi:NitT/TauT family transport system substrate-binding protein